jgi:Predicted drug exporters of the RND superfamily
VFALLFSLGIDYDMFIILRIKEEKGKDEDERIIKGITYTGLVVTAAGLILAGAFFSLISADMRFLEEIGFSVGFSVIFDTFIVRPIFVPAIMSILKKYNWWPFAS